MKRIIAVLLALALLMGLCACGGKSGDDTPAQSPSGDKADSTAPSPTPEAGPGVQVDEKLFSVDITLPAMLFEDESAEEIIASAKEQGIDKCVVNDDGSVTYTMSHAKRQELLESIRESTRDSIRELLEGENAVASFEDISFNKDMSEFTITVNEQYTMWDLFNMFTFYFIGVYYQIFAGADPDTLDVLVNFVDGAGNVVESGSYRKFMENSADGGDEEAPGDAGEEGASAPLTNNLPELSLGESVVIEDECEFYVDFFNIDSRIDPPSPGSWYTYYEADRDKLYVDICVAWKNLGSHPEAADEVLGGRLIYGGRYRYEGFSIIEEGNRDDFTYSNITDIAPLTTGYVHYLFPVPKEVGESGAALWAELDIGGKKYMLRLREGDENYTPDSGADVRTAGGKVAEGELVSVPGKCEFFVDMYQITERVEPPRPDDYYSYYAADRGMVYVDLCLGYKNLKTQEVMADEVMEAGLTYADKYEYDGFPVIEESDRGDLTYANITAIAPLCTEYIHYLFSVPESVKDSGEPIVVDFSIGGKDFSFTVR